mmetsp:Transcript_26623/g.83492  ORF Transcript_26623/g.83492 Transcript_26623/m.83492 type:complete len:283 (-) Transcript_26623:68-916(-)
MSQQRGEGAGRRRRQRAPGVPARRGQGCAHGASVVEKPGLAGEPDHGQVRDAVKETGLGLAVQEQQQSAPGLAAARRAAHAVDVVLAALGGKDLDHQRDVGVVHAALRDAGGEEHARGAVAELALGDDARGRLAARVELIYLHLQLAPEEVGCKSGQACRREERDDLVTRGAQRHIVCDSIPEGGEQQQTRADRVKLLDGLLRGRVVPHAVQEGVVGAAHVGGQVADLVRNGCRHEERPSRALWRQAAEHGPQCVHVLLQQVVALVQDERAQRLEERAEARR